MEDAFSLIDLDSQVVKAIVEYKKNDGDLNAIADIVMVEELKHPDEQFFKGLRSLGFYEMLPEEQVTLFIYIDCIIQNGLQPIEFSDYNGGKRKLDLIRAKNRLIKDGIVETSFLQAETCSASDSRNERTILSADACGKLFHGKMDIIPYSSISKQAQIITKASIKKKELFFDDQDMGQVERLRKFLNPDNYAMVMDRLATKGHKQSAMCVFYGDPGTGKTELAKQLALESGRDVFLADIAKLNGSFNGDSEKNYRQLFRSYRYFAKISTEVPILLLNEADALLGRRLTEIHQAIDTLVNNIQNILLQELEDFEGILIATTNLFGNMDSAFERRFLFKVNFHKPSVTTRRKIWKAVMPDISDFDASALASSYSLTGAQIANVAQKREIDEALDGVMPDLKQMIEYCDSELMNGDEERPKIGFIYKNNNGIKC